MTHVESEARKLYEYTPEKEIFGKEPTAHPNGGHKINMILASADLGIL